MNDCKSKTSWMGETPPFCSQASPLLNQKPPPPSAPAAVALHLSPASPPSLGAERGRGQHPAQRFPQGAQQQHPYQNWWFVWNGAPHLLQGARENLIQGPDAFLPIPGLWGKVVEKMGLGAGGFLEQEAGPRLSRLGCRGIGFSRSTCSSPSRLPPPSPGALQAPPQMGSGGARQGLRIPGPLLFFPSSLPELTQERPF